MNKERIRDIILGPIALALIFWWASEVYIPIRLFYIGERKKVVVEYYKLIIEPPKPAIKQGGSVFRKAKCIGMPYEIRLNGNKFDHLKAGDSAEVFTSDRLQTAIFIRHNQKITLAYLFSHFTDSYIATGLIIIPVLIGLFLLAYFALARTFAEFKLAMKTELKKRRFAISRYLFVIIQFVNLTFSFLCGWLFSIILFELSFRVESIHVLVLGAVVMMAFLLFLYGPALILFLYTKLLKGNEILENIPNLLYLYASISIFKNLVSFKEQSHLNEFHTLIGALGELIRHLFGG